MGQSGKEQRCSSHTKHEDRLSMLTDDILLSILGRVDITTATRTSVLSKRWRDLPRLLPVLNLRVWDFLPYPYPEPIAAHHVDQAMSRLTKATRSFLAEPSSKSTVIKRLSLQLYVTGDYAHEIGPLARDAIDCGVVKKLYLAIVDEKEPRDCEHEDMLQQARAVVRFITAYPGVFQCLTKLHLYNVRFPEWDIHYLLFDSCKQLKQLFLCHCDVGDSSVWQINAPNSKLRILKVRMSCLKRIEVLCLPKLKHLHWDEWFCFEAPLRFGFVPSLKGLGLICGATVDHQEFSLSQVLHGTRDIHTLTLDFQGERLWIHPEGKQLCSAFKKLRKLSIGGIFVDFDLLWTINLLEAAPSVEIFSVRLWDHACQDDEQLRTTTGYEAQRTKPSWSMPKFTSSETWQLRELEFVGFRPLEQQISFLRSVMERAPNLKTVLLKEDKDPCEDCDSMNVPRGGFCPTDKGEQEIIVKQLRDGIRSTARIIFPNGGYS